LLFDLEFAKEQKMHCFLFFLMLFQVNQPGISMDDSIVAVESGLGESLHQGIPIIHGPVDLQPGTVKTLELRRFEGGLAHTIVLFDNELSLGDSTYRANTKMDAVLVELDYDEPNVLYDLLSHGESLAAIRFFELNYHMLVVNHTTGTARILVFDANGLDPSVNPEPDVQDILHAVEKTDDCAGANFAEGAWIPFKAFEKCFSGNGVKGIQETAPPITAESDNPVSHNSEKEENEGSSGSSSGGN